MSAEHDGPDERFERAFSEALGRAGDAFDTEPGPLADTGWSYGRRLRRRRRAGTAAGAAALALAGVGGAALGGLLPGQGAAVAGPAAASPAGPVSGPEFQRMLTELLPPGTVQEGEGRGTESGTPQVRLTLDDGHGPAQYLFWITRFGVGDVGCPARQTQDDACTEATLPDGDHLRLYQAATRGGEPAGSKTWSAVLTGKGYQLALQEWNRKPLEQGTPITRTDPPLTMDQLSKVVTDPRWKEVAEALPKDPVMGKLVTSAPTPGPGFTPPGDTAAVQVDPATPQTGPVTLPAFPAPAR
ncbi:hypothetical protein [Kitasatospora sp. SUK 42]|uniref:hypothetical protein n=1 Tax=Kitasatospora sp. SUK 42 TaxID=1588882 RepID=UPI001C3123C8|nr:hypothetical protein [Kitasatospora sp. SUK 42]MBV2154610.1 hypothetical protein [Kitasatospora sp. SUK 42]